MKLSKKYSSKGSISFVVAISKGKADQLGWINQNAEQIVILKDTIEGNKLIIEGVK